MKRYGELIEYLLNKSPDIHALQMDFEGKNIMLYYLGAGAHFSIFSCPAVTNVVWLRRWP